MVVSSPIIPEKDPLPISMVTRLILFKILNVDTWVNEFDPITIDFKFSQSTSL